MLSYCFKCRKNTKSINPKVSKTTKGKAIILSTSAICGSKKSKFIKEQEAKGLLSNLGLRTPLLVDHLLGMKKEFKSLKKLVIQTMYTKMN